ncbi:hypothetical protein CW421_004678 [Escherichia coli]|nr:hypothetical protein [Escherichia coli]EEC7202599.1 hypothetical protein [Escherichia coli O11]EIG2640064.1 hypothetical protein [Shigella sonnei]AMF91075.1 hypothetical protein AL551_23745 [Escherichia coli]AWS37513.1 hypothetical protein DL800_17850 [Escherichia coli]EEC7464418.1 hypothetical protein [Escherichia coli]
MAELSDFLPYVRRHISGPLNIMMTDALSMAAVAFSRQSLVCRREVTVVPVAGKEIVLPYDKDDEECVHIIRISDDNHELFVGRDVDISSGRSLRFACSPGEVSVLYAVAPKAGRSQIPDELLTWPEEVAAGALERLFMQTGVSWSDPLRAQYFSVQFSEGIRRAYRHTLATSPYSSYRNPARRQRFY